MLGTIPRCCRSKMKGAQKHSAVELTISSWLGMVERADLAGFSFITNTT